MALEQDGKNDQKPSASASRTTSKPRGPTPSLLSSFFNIRPRSDGPSNLDERLRQRRERAQEWGRAREKERKRDGDRDGDSDSDWVKGHRRSDPLHSPRARATRRSRHTTSQRATSPKPVKMDVKSLDHGYLDWKITVKLGLPVLNLEPAIRRTFEASGQPLGTNALFRFFASDGSELTQGDVVTSTLSPIWYRVSRFLGNVKTWRFTHYQDNTHGRLDAEFTDELVRSIDSGATVKQLRRKIADQWNIHDANRVLLVARGGFRPGSIKGNDWVVKEIKEKWLCRWIAIDICRSERYFVLKGLKREYILHPEGRLEYTLQMKEILREKVFRNVRQQHGESSFSLPSRRIAIFSNGEVVTDSQRPVWGAEYTFEIPDVYEAEVFSNEEGWLLPATETCTACVEDKKISDLPVRVTAGCKHEATTCKACLEQWLASSLESQTWDRLKCPECLELLKHADVHRYASKATFSRYDDLATRGVLTDMPNFRWCLSTSCTSGQIDDVSCTKFNCKECKKSHCIRHNVPWHKGETCDEYDKRNKNRLKEGKAAEKFIKKTSKKCPRCKMDVHKWMGCDHITCVCGHEWCYICFAKYERDDFGLPSCQHKPGCSGDVPFPVLNPAEVGPFLDLAGEDRHIQMARVEVWAVPGPELGRPPPRPNAGGGNAQPVAVFPPEPLQFQRLQDLDTELLQHIETERLQHLRLAPARAMHRGVRVQQQQ